MTHTPPIRLLTIDRLPLVHAGVRQLLAAFPDIEPVGEAYDLGDALALGASRAPTAAPRRGRAGDAPAPRAPRGARPERVARFELMW